MRRGLAIAEYAIISSRANCKRSRDSSPGAAGLGRGRVIFGGHVPWRARRISSQVSMRRRRSMTRAAREMSCSGLEDPGRYQSRPMSASGILDTVVPPLLEVRHHIDSQPRLRPGLLFSASPGVADPKASCQRKACISPASTIGARLCRLSANIAPRGYRPRPCCRSARGDLDQARTHRDGRSLPEGDGTRP